MLVDGISYLFMLVFVLKRIMLKKLSDRKMGRLISRLIIRQSVWELEPEIEAKAK